MLLARRSVAADALDNDNGGLAADAASGSNAGPLRSGESPWVGSATPTGKKPLSARLFPPTEMMLLIMEPLPTLRTTCARWGGLFDSSGAVRGVYRVQYHVKNSGGSNECDVAERLVVVEHHEL